MYSQWVAACVAAFAVLGGPRWQEPERQARAEAWSRVIVDETLGRGEPALDPLLVVALVFAESSFVPTVRGARGEVGLLQTHPATAWRMGWDPEELAESPEAQLRAGIRVLRDGRSLCGSGLGALAYHNRGRCEPRPRQLRLVRRVAGLREALAVLEPRARRAGAAPARAGAPAP